VTTLFRSFGLALAVGACLATPLLAQPAPDDFKSLYATAEYEKALGVLAPLDSAEAQQYKALCLLALGRTSEATDVLKSLITESPTFVPSAEESPPRFVELVTETRRQLLPGIARRIFAEGRERFAEKKADEAVARFNLVLTLAADPDFTDAAAAQDLKTLAQGFIDLARATAPPPPRPTTAAAAPAPAPPPSPPTVTQPVALVQNVPSVPTTLSGPVGAKLVVVLSIDAEGKVTSASVQQSAHPVYDRMVQQAARGWRYTPGTRDGVRIASEQTVTIQITR
jgi:TonB family protein